MRKAQIYFRAMKLNIKCQAEYPASFWMNVLSQFVMLASELMAVLLIFDRFPALGKWSREDILFIFGLISVSFYTVEFLFRGFTNFSPIIRSGTLDTMLLRPRGILFQIMFSDFDLRRIGSIAVGLAALIAGAVRGQVNWNGLKILLLFESLFCGGALICGLFMIEAIFCIRSVKSVEMVNILTYGGRSACQYPIDIYPDFIRFIFIFIAPFALTVHLPAAFILEKTLLDIPEWLTFILPLSGILFLMIMCFLFTKMMKKYCSTGN